MSGLRCPLLPANKCILQKRLRSKPRLGLCVVRTRAAADGSGDSDTGAPPTLYGDWREFRAKLVADAGKVNWANRLSEDNIRLLEVQNPKLAAEETWAHATTHPEKGGLLLATPTVSRILGTDNYWQVVVLLVQCTPAGAVGLILNRPSGLRMGVGRGGLKFSIIGAPAGMQDVFADSRVYCGGMVRQDVFHLLHGHNLEGSLELAPGVYVGGEAAAVTAAREGLIAAEEFKFFCGAMVWEGDELQKEIERGAWWEPYIYLQTSKQIRSIKQCRHQPTACRYTAAGSRNLALKQCLQLPKPLWREVLGLMGGDYAQIADNDC